MAAPTDSGVGVGAVDGGDEAAAVHDEDAVAHAEDLRQLAGDHQDRHALLGEAAHQRVDLGLGADVDAAGRLVHDQDARRGLEPLAEHDLLLVAAGELADHLLRAAGADAELLDRGGGALAPRRAKSMKMPRAMRAQRGHRGVLGDGHRPDEALQAAVLGDVGDAEVAGLARRGDGDRAAVELDACRRWPG